MVHVEGASGQSDIYRLLASRLRAVGFYLLVILLLLPFVFVFFWMGTSSFKTQRDIFTVPPVWLFEPTWNNYRLVFQEQPFLRYVTNSAIVAVSATAIGMILGLPAAYSVARYRQSTLALGILAARIMPGVAYLVPLFLLFGQLDILGSHAGLILSHVLVTFPLTVWVLIGFFEDIPQDLNDAALIDGCSRLGSFVRIAIPLAQPGIVATAILSFIFSWNDFKFALILSNSETRTLPVAIYGWVGAGQVEWGAIMASATMVTLPILLLSLFVQKYIVAGLTIGGVKG